MSALLETHLFGSVGSVLPKFEHLFYVHPQDSKYIPILEAWRRIDYKKVRARINSVIRAISK